MFRKGPCQTEAHLSKKLLAEHRCFTGCVFEEPADGLNQQSQGCLDSVRKSRVGEHHVQDGHQGQSRSFCSGIAALQVDRQTLHHQGQEGRQVSQNLVSLLGPVDRSVRSWKQHARTALGRPLALK